VIEVDGSIHNISENKEYDAGRTFELNDLGIKVLRFTNDEIEKDLSGSLQKLTTFIKENCL
jgi:very-short-patch-repair endonuclease